MRRLLLLISALLVLALAAVPAVADGGSPLDDDAEASEEFSVGDGEPCTDDEGDLELAEPSEVFLKEADTKAGNLAALGAHDFPTWDENAPEDSVTDGAGGGYLASRNTGETPVVADEPDDLGSFRFEGAAPACIDTIAVEIYSLDATEGALTSAETIRPQLVIDDTIIYRHFDSAGFDAEFSDNPNGDASTRVRFAFTDIHQSLERNGLLDPEGGEHDVRINITPQFINTGAAIIYVYDTVEVPSGVTFNAGDLDGVPTIRVNL